MNMAFPYRCSSKTLIQKVKYFIIALQKIFRLFISLSQTHFWKQYEKSHDDIEVKRVKYVQFSGDITNTGIFKSILELLHSF